MMMGGHKFSISPEEYVFAAIAIYLDILNLFLYILRILSNFKCLVQEWNSVHFSLKS